jgi:DNA-3-methyladenine glycosylase II
MQGVSNTILINHFIKSDSVIIKLIDKFGVVEINPSRNYFSDLVESIINQQLSNKAAATIWKRFQDLFPLNKITPELVIKTDINKIKSCGTSNAKAQYIKNIAQAFLDQTVKFEKFNELSNEEIIDQLIQVKGIGKWTAEMFLIFSLGREDVFSMGDAGLAKAINNIYGKGKSLSIKQKEKIISKWTPYKSYASLLLWKSLYNTPKPGV